MNVAAALMLALALAVQQPPGASLPEDANGLPRLNLIRHAVLGPSYSCRTKEEFARGYEETALWLSDVSRDRNTPDLLFDGACGSQNYFVVAASDDDLGLIADLGPGVPLTELHGRRAIDYGGGEGHETSFTQSALIVPGHTYVVLLNRPEVRGLYAMTVTRFTPDRKAEFDYVVLKYDVRGGAGQK